ncbi:beta-lactamase family protein [Virgibacillus dakarensis]|uniref:serine hydrolase domain-containing protein n=1 Tax=Virgibacillus dakarensis TaxID=1917889 RepID=UPI000B445F1A|nr:serine hydrolase [Virgibacillus dakarensis]MBT2214584.1 beta-lactamase family protein [Virgibacillus dakarensis]
MKFKNVINRLNAIQKEVDFSGTVYVKVKDSVFTESYGYANRTEKIANQVKTRYGIASGCKIFTAIAICQLVEQGKLRFETRLVDCLDIPFPYFDEGVTVHHLLTHTSGIPDYFDEDEMDDYEELWLQKPMYLIRRLHDFLPFFQNEQMKSPAGATFHYNNAGYIVLGLIIEQVSGYTFSDYVEQFIFKKAGMNDSGYFEMDSLPERVAYGYIKKPDGGYRTNIYSIPVKGGSDGGAYVTAEDMVKCWEELSNYKLLTKEMTEKLLTPQIQVEEDIFYGYGLYMQMDQDKVVKYILMGYDPGINFRAVFYPETSLNIVVCSNKSDGAYEVITGIQEALR